MVITPLVKLRPCPDDVGGSCMVALETAGGRGIGMRKVRVRMSVTAPDGETMFLYGPLGCNGWDEPLASQAEAVRCFMEQHRA